MVAAGSETSSRLDDDEQRVVLHGLAYKDYVAIIDALGHRPSVRVTYLRGMLEIMVTSPRHELLKKLIARLVELHALVRGVRITGIGSATFRREDAECGLEPDECYCIDSVKDMPDLAMEVVVSNRKLEVYRGLGVTEVWVYEGGRFTVHELGPAGYEPRATSRWFPDIDFALLAEHVELPDQDDAVRAYWARLQST